MIHPLPFSPGKSTLQHKTLREEDYLSPDPADVMCLGVFLFFLFLSTFQNCYFPPTLLFFDMFSHLPQRAKPEESRVFVRLS